MREVLNSAPRREVAALRVVAAFDEAVLETPDLTSLADVAQGLTGHRVGVREMWDDRLVVMGYADDDDLDVPREAVRARVRGRDARALSIDGRTVLVASIEVAMGTVGFCWLECEPGRTFAATDHLVVERLATSVAAVALQERSQRTALARVEEGAIERLLSGPLPELELAEVTRMARLPLDRPVRAVALAQEPHNGVSAVALAEDLVRRLRAHGATTRVATLASMVAVLTSEVAHLDEAIGEVVENYGKLRITVRVGVGEDGPVENAHVSWRQAREALALHALASRGEPVVRFADLGALMLLACIDEQRLLESPLYRRLTDELVDSRTPPDLELLEVFLDEGSLRKTAARVFLHHTTVESRIRRIADLLDVDLADQRIRFELQLLIKTARVINARARS